jgi:DNA-binding MarR family transcriptional regulator
LAGDDAPTPAQVLAASSALLAVLRSFVLRLSQNLSADESTLTFPQFRVLVVLCERGPLRNIDLANALGVDPSVASRICSRLAQKQLVLSERSERSQRELQIALAPAGRQLLQQLPFLELEPVREVLSALDGEHLDDLTRVLRQVAGALEASALPAEL